jgi:uncharacterized protein YceH (UPF0502 family)
MALKLNEIERRVLGTLIEKWLTTPQGYPLSLNSLTNGCNQKSARDPETSYTEQQVEQTCMALKTKSLAMQFFGAGARVSKWEEALCATMHIEKAEAAVLAELMLRGPQSEGELRGRASRMVDLPTLEALHAVLEQLRTRQEPLVQRLSEQGRVRGVRWAHTFYADGEVLPAESPASPAAASGGFNTSPPPAAGGIDPIAAIMNRLTTLEQRVSELERRTQGL